MENNKGIITIEKESTNIIDIDKINDLSDLSKIGVIDEDIFWKVIDKLNIDKSKIIHLTIPLTGISKVCLD